MRTIELPVIGKNTVSAQSFILVDTGHLSPKKKLASPPRKPSSNARVVPDAGVFASETTRVARSFVEEGLSGPSSARRVRYMPGLDSADSNASAFESRAIHPWIAPEGCLSTPFPRTTNPSVIAPGVAAVGRGAASRAVALKLGNTHSQQTRSQSWL